MWRAVVVRKGTTTIDVAISHRKAGGGALSVNSTTCPGSGAAMPRSITLTFPWTPKELSPNARPNRYKKASATKQYRRDCYLEARNQVTLAVLQPQSWLASPVLATTTFYVDSKRRYDLDNLNASLKPLWDGVVDAGILVDDSSEHLRHGESKVVVGSERKVEVRLEEVE